jgi:hypothetical protein
VFDEALAVCESFEWPLDQAQGMAELIERLGTTRPRRDALELLLRARQMVATLDDAEDRDGVLSQVANAYSTLGATEEWREVLGRIQRPDYRMTVLAARVGRTDDLWEEMLSTGRDAMSRADASCLAWAFDDAIAACLTMGRMDAAGEFLAMLPEGPWKDSQRRKICEALMKSGELQRAQQLAGEIQAPYARALMYGALARVYRKDGIAEKTLEMLRCAADSVPYLGPIATDLEAIGVVDLGTLLSKNGFEKEGAECARQAQTWLCRVHTYYRARPFIRLAHEATLAGDRDRAKEAMESAGLVANDTYSFAAMAAQYEAMGLSVAAARAVERMVESCEPDPALRMSTLQQIAEEYRAAGQRFSAEVASLLERLT